MSSPTRPADHTTELAVDMASLKESHKAVKSDLDSLDIRMGGLEREMRHGFATLSDSLGRMTAPKGAPWPMISVAAIIFLALASWANTYFGQGIAAASKAAAVASEQHQTLANRIDLISNRQHEDAVNAARSEGFQDAATKAAEKERERLRLEIDRMSGAGKAGG